MKSSSLHEIKAELEQIDRKSLMEICLRLAKFKKENKELTSFLLFESDDLANFLEETKKEIEAMFTEINISNVYYIKKGVRKILKTANRFIRFAGDKPFEAELLIHFCNCMVDHSIPVHKSTALNNIYLSQKKKLNGAIGSLHPDLQFDFKRQLKSFPTKK